MDFASPPPVGLGNRLERDLLAIFGDLQVGWLDEGFPVDDPHD
jgi:hypothetical protein